MASSIVWTTLPASFDPDAGTMSVSVLVSPRIDDAPTVGQSKFADWPSTIANAKFSVALEYGPAWNGAPIDCKVANAAFDSALWAAIFPASTAIKGYKFQDNSQRQLWSYSVDQLNAAIEAVYAYVAQSSATAFPTIDLSQVNALASWINNTSSTNDARIRERTMLFQNVTGGKMTWPQQTAHEKAVLAQLADPVAQHIWLMKRFYDRPSNLKDGKGNMVLTGDDGHGNKVPVAIPRPKAPQFDFHEKVALLGDHPLLEERLCLVVKLTFPAPRDLQKLGYVRVIPAWGGPSGYDVTPRTAFEIVGRRFEARGAAGGDVVNGMLAVDNANLFGVFQVDVDGDGHKTVDYASNIHRYAAQFLAREATNSGRPYVAPQESLPARRNAGFTITRKNRANALQARFVANAQMYPKLVPNPALNQPPATTPPDLFADDVTRGYRVDVSVDGAPWRSLHQRSTHYMLGLPGAQSEVIAPRVDEGYVKAASATSDDDPSGPQDMYVHEAVFGWSGWSLAAPRPGQSLWNGGSGDDKPTGQGVQQGGGLGATPDFPVDANIRVAPGTLPALRFGRKYSFRARMVDLTGGSADLKDTTLGHATPPVAYQRYEPIPTPVTVLTAVVTEGESVDHLVIRSDGSATPASYAATLQAQWNDQKSVSMTVAGDPQYKTYSGTSDRHVAPPKCSQTLAETHGRFDAVFAGGDLQTYFCLGTREEGTFMDFQIPSLSDPTQYIGGNPNGAAIITPPQVPYDQRRDPNQAPTGSSLVTNRGDALSPGEYVVCTAWQATTPYLPDPAAFGTVLWDPQAAAGDLINAPWKPIAGHDWPDWAPYRLQLVGGSTIGMVGGTETAAVRQYQLPPGTMRTLRLASTPDAQRAINGEFAYVNTYAPSSDYLAGRHWMLTPYKEIKMVHAVPQPLKAPVALLKPYRLYDDTIVRFESTSLATHAGSTGEVEITGSWDEYTDSPTLPVWTKQTQTGRAFRAEIPYADGVTSTIVGNQKHELGDTKHRVVKYASVATTRYKEYFPARLIADPKNITTQGTAMGGDMGVDVFDILSTARPKAPKIAYVVPTFKWVQSADLKTSTRKGNGLRVYFERPWFSSGQDEQIAVLVQPAGIGVAPAILPYISRWGRDPIWDGKGNGSLDASKLLNGGTPVSLQIAELPGTNVLAVPFNVEYCHERQLWFVDIVMDAADTYFPFVSLAISRYQPYSLAGVELSPMVRADFAQLLPDRTLQIATRPTAISVTLTGPVADTAFGDAVALQSPQGTPPTGRVWAPRARQLKASLQQRTVGTVGDLGWNTIANTSIDLAGTTPLNSQVATWTGIVNVPLANGLERRLVVEEYEVLLNDAGFFSSTPRLVYLDTLPLSAS